MKIAISTTTFGAEDISPVDYLKNHGYQILCNKYGRQVTAEELIELAAGACGIIAGTEKITDEVMATLTALKVISRCGAGVDNVDLDSAKRRGIKVFTTPDAPTSAVAELTIGLIFSLARSISASDRMVRSGLWKKRMGSLVSGKCAGIIGFGRIGRKVASLLSGLGCKVIYYDSDLRIKDDVWARPVGLDELFSNSDIITIHVSGVSKGCLINETVLKTIKRGVYIVNTSRGSVIDEDAIYAALKDGRIAGAALDVFSKEPYTGSLMEFDNVILSPHIGSYAREARIAMEMEAAKNLVSALEDVK